MSRRVELEPEPKHKQPKAKAVKPKVAASTRLMIDVMPTLPVVDKVDENIPRPKRINFMQLTPILGLMVLSLVILSGVMVFRVFLTNHSSRQPSGDVQGQSEKAGNSNQAGVGQQQVQSSTQKSGIQSTQPSIVPGPPTFTVYYPPKPPQGLSVDKSSITYSKNSFVFSLKQDGQSQFFINEQPAGDDFSFQRLKGKMGTPGDIDTALGKGVLGTLAGNFIMAVNTDKNTLIIVNCTAIACAVPTKELIASLTINADPTHIR